MGLLHEENLEHVAVGAAVLGTVIHALNIGRANHGCLFSEWVFSC